MPRQSADWLAMTGNDVTLWRRLVAAPDRAVQSDTFLTAYRIKCHCEPVTDVTGVAIRFLRDRLIGRKCYEIRKVWGTDCHASLRTGSQ